MDSKTEDTESQDKLFYNRLSEFYDAAPETTETAESSVESDSSNRYIQKSLIASGGAKEIFRVYDQKIGRFVAMACLKKDSPKELQEPFLREAKLTAKLDHPNIIKIFDIGKDTEWGPYFTMELKTGKSFRQQIQVSSEREKLGKGLDVLLKICDAISYAHSKQVLHLDLKPENIEIGEYGEVIVCDWGCGKVLHQEEENLDHLIFNPDLLNQMTLSGKIKGTPGYMAPEQIDKGKEKSFQTDIYALGAMLFEIVFGEPLHKGSQKERMNKTLKGKILFPEQQQESALCAVIAKSCETDQSLRYATVGEFKRDIQQYLQGYSPDAENASLSKLVYLFYKRNKRLCILSTAFMLTFIFSSLIYIFFLNESHKEALNAKRVAEKERQTALIYRSEAERQLEILKSVRLKHAEVLYRDSHLLKPYYFDNPQKEIKYSLDKLNQALQLDHENRELLRDKANLLFLTQNYKEALSIYESIDFENQEIVNLCRRFGDLELNENNLIDLESLKIILHQVSAQSWRRDFSEKILAYDYQKRTQNRNYAECVATLVKRYKKTGSKFEFHYNTDKGALKIDSPELFRLSVRQWGSGLCLLRFLDLNELDLSGTKVSDLKELKGMTGLKTLDICDTLITDLSYLNAMNIETLKVEQGQFSPLELSKLKKSIRVMTVGKN